MQYTPDLNYRNGIFDRVSVEREAQDVKHPVRLTPERASLVIAKLKAKLDTALLSNNPHHVDQRLVEIAATCVAALDIPETRTADDPGDDGDEDHPPAPPSPVTEDQLDRELTSILTERR